MADFSHLQNTMAAARGEKPKKKAKAPKESKPKKEKKAKKEKAPKEKKGKEKKASKEKKPSKSSSKPAAAPAVAKGDAMGKKMGGIDWAAIDKQNKAEAKKAKAAAAKNPQTGGVSKIFAALNPQSLWKETKAEKIAKQDDDNIMVVEVRGAGGMGALAADDMMIERDDQGNAIFEVESEESDFEDADLAEFDPDTMDELTRKRMERAREADERRKALRKSSMIAKEKEAKELAKTLAKIEKQKAAEAKKEGITDKDVKATQARLEAELTFEGFGFGD